MSPQGDMRHRLAEFAATVALCEWENGDWPDYGDLVAMRPGGQYIAQAVLKALDDGTAPGLRGLLPHLAEPVGRCLGCRAPSGGFCAGCGADLRDDAWYTVRYGADAAKFRRLLAEWLEQGAAMGGGPRADLTQRTLDALGPPCADCGAPPGGLCQGDPAVCCATGGQG